MPIQPAIETALNQILPPEMNSIRARVMLLAIQKQEDPELLRYQRVKRTPRTRPENYLTGTDDWAKGPARGPWQMEQDGGVKGVLQHRATKAIAAEVCVMHGVLPVASDVWRMLEYSDILAACFARLLLWSDPKPLPDVHDTEGAWQLYLRTWRPGAYTNGTAGKRAELRAKWAKNHAATLADLGIA